MIGIVLSANSDEHVEVAEEIGHDRGERCVLVGGPYTSVSVDIERDGYGYVFGHGGFLLPEGPAI